MDNSPCVTLFLSLAVLVGGCATAPSEVPEGHRAVDPEPAGHTDTPLAAQVPQPPAGTPKTPSTPGEAVARSAMALRHGGVTYPEGIQILLSDAERACESAWVIAPATDVLRLSLDASDPTSRLVAGSYDLPLPLGAYRMARAEGACTWHPTVATSARLRIDTIDDAHVTGNVDVVLADGAHRNYDFDAPFCIGTTPAPWRCEGP